MSCKPTKMAFFAFSITPMKSFRFLLVTVGSVLLINTFSFSQNQDIKIVIEGVKDAKGTIWVALFNSEEQFMKERFRSLKLTPQQGQVIGVFEDIPAGNYAITVMHDANNNKELDKNAIGIPQEGFGFSNNAMGRFGPPDYKKVVFEFPKQKEIAIKLRYM